MANLQNRPAQRFAILALGATLALCALTSAAPASAQSGAATPGAAASDAARDDALKAFLQKRFRIPALSQMKLGPMSPTPLPGIFMRTLTVTNDKGGSASVTLLGDRDQTKVIIGQYLDVSEEAWGRADLRPLHLDDRPTLGPADAPVTLIEFADFECPFCAHAFGAVETLVNTTYKGKLRLIFKNYPLSGHPWARVAAAAAECARLQNPALFWDFARFFYANQPTITPGNVKEQADAEAGKFSLDRKVFDACMNGTGAADRVNQDAADGNAVHVTSTPTFFINGIPLVGLPEGRVFDFVIGSELGTGAHASP